MTHNHISTSVAAIGPYRAETKPITGTNTRRRLFMACVVTFIAATFCTAMAFADARVEFGSGNFVFAFPSDGRIREIPVWYHRPQSVEADAPIVFVMHGAGRTAQNYRKYWITIAEERRFVLLVPEFSRAQFRNDYNLERLARADGELLPKAEWPYTAIERIFDTVRKDNGFTATTYDIYGHSAGAQFVHRLAFLIPEARYRVAVAANAGWYTMPEFDIAYPYGLAGSPATASTLSAVLGRKLVVLLGDWDIDPNHRDLRRTPEANLQGEHRYARGHAFFARAKAASAALGVPFNWELHTAPGVAHSNARMTPHAWPFVGGR